MQCNAVILGNTVSEIPNLSIGGVQRWIRWGKWGGAALRHTPNYEHEVAPHSSKPCHLRKIDTYFQMSPL